MSFQQLTVHLGLDTELNHQKKLEILEQWVHEKISEDIIFIGSSETKYQQYLFLAEYYLDKFLSNIPETVDFASKFSGMNIIHYAAYRGYHHFLNTLELPKHYWSEPNQEGLTCLHLAATQGHEHTVSVLLSKGADLEKNNKLGQPPVFTAALMPLKSDPRLIAKKENIIRHLLKHAPGLISHQDNNKDTLFHLLATYGFNQLMQELLEQQSHSELIATPNNTHQYPIHNAILNNHIQIIRMLLKTKHVAALNDANGQVALHYAAAYGTQETVKLCHQATDTINVLDNLHRTPIMLAVQNKNKSAIDYLLHHHANVNSLDKNGHSILHYAIWTEDDEFASWFLEQIVLKLDQLTINVEELDLSNSPVVEGLLIAKGMLSKEQSPRIRIHCW